MVKPQRAIEPDEAHVWQVDLADPAWDGYAVLCVEERERAQAFRAEALTQRHRRARTALRMLLGGYLERAPADIRLTYGPYGKPKLIGEALQFNLSHSADQCLIAVASVPVGVDIETLGPEIDPASLLDLVCHPQEKEELAGLAYAPLRTRFLSLWVLKEAYCKALGLGLQLDLPSVRMWSVPLEPMFRVLDQQRPDTISYVHPLPCPTHFRASLCIPLQYPRLEIRRATASSSLIWANQKIFVRCS